MRPAASLIGTISVSPKNAVAGQRRSFELEFVE
jgi:hypothetical protein